MKMTPLMERVALAVAACVLAGAAAVARADDGKALYDKSCVSCHGAGGKGDGAAAKMLKPPPQDFATVLQGKSDADIAKVIKEGGKATGMAASMPAYGSKMTDDQIKEVVQYIKGLK